jgi:hypothetical protein
MEEPVGPQHGFLAQVVGVVPVAGKMHGGGEQGVEMGQRLCLELLAFLRITRSHH